MGKLAVKKELENKVKLQGCQLNAQTREIFVFFEDFDITKEMIQLRDEFKYIIQTEMFRVSD
jgi:hypothetical protein